MEELNNYIYNVFKLILETQQSGYLKRPKTLTILKSDKKTLNNIYKVYKLYKCGLSKKDFHNICRDYCVTSGFNIIKAGSEMAELLEKTKNK